MPYLYEHTVESHQSISDYIVTMMRIKLKARINNIIRFKDTMNYDWKKAKLTDFIDFMFKLIPFRL